MSRETVAKINNTKALELLKAFKVRVRIAESLKI